MCENVIEDIVPTIKFKKMIKFHKIIILNNAEALNDNQKLETHLAELMFRPLVYGYIYTWFVQVIMKI